MAGAHSDEALRFAAEMVREGAARIDRTLDSDFDFCASILGAISLDGEAAREGARIAAAFYISSLPPELVERHGIPFAEVEPVVEAFDRGDIDSALAFVPASVGAQLSLAGTPQEWIERIRRDFLPHGYNHIALGLADPFLVERWSGTLSTGYPRCTSSFNSSTTTFFPPSTNNPPHRLTTKHAGYASAACASVRECHPTGSCASITGGCSQLALRNAAGLGAPLVSGPSPGRRPDNEPGPL